MSPFPAAVVRTRDGIDFYLIRGNSDHYDSVPCLAAAAGPHSAIACSGPTGGVTSGSPAYQAQLVQEPAIDGDGWVAISDNVRVPAELGTTE